MKIILIGIVFCIITFLFYKASGTLSLKKINIISYTYYSVIIFNYIGASLVLLGFREHYLIHKISEETTIILTFSILVYALISLGVWLLFFNKIFGKRNMKKIYQCFLDNNIEIQWDGKKVYYVIAFFSFVCFLAMLYMFCCIGYIPLFKLFSSGFDTATARIEISRNYKGNVYIKNFIVIMLTPLLSYVSYVNFRVTKKRKWLGLFLIQMFMCVLIKTYDFSKSPLLNYLIGFYFIETLLGNVKSLKKLVVLGGIVFVIIIIQYGGFNNIGNYLTIYSGPLGRIFMTQIATLFLHVQAFPKYISYLNGTSLPTILARLIGKKQSWVRSGRVIMEFYNPSGVKAGTAGVMNTIFVGEAYANWGWLGVILSPIIVAFVLSLSFNFIINAKKTPLNIVIYMALIQTFTGALQGGFVDFLYNSGIIVIIVVLKSLQIMSRGGKIYLKKL